MYYHINVVIIIVTGSYSLDVVTASNCGEGLTFTVRNIRVTSTSTPTVTSSSSIIQCHNTCLDSGLSEPAAFFFNNNTDECSCYDSSVYKIMTVYPSHHRIVNDTIPTAELYLVELDVYACRQIYNNVEWETTTGYIKDQFNGTPDFAHTLSCEDIWTLFLRRVSNSVDFNQNWDNYVEGFGNIHENFWLGLENIHRGTSVRGNNVLRIYLESFDDADTAMAQYLTFSVAGADTLYRLTNGGYSGEAGDSFGTVNGMAFSTIDQDHDTRAGSACTDLYPGGWWYKTCHQGTLTGPYCDSATAESRGLGITWAAYKGLDTCLKTAIMSFQ